MKNDLLHSAIDEASDDSLMHYGVRGMHWGSRKGKRFAASGNATEGIGTRNALGSIAKGVGNVVAHPVIGSRIRIKNALKHPIMNLTSPMSMMKKNNQEIRSKVLKNKDDKEIAYKKRNAIGDARKKVLDAKSKRNKVDWNNPNSVSKADKAVSEAKRDLKKTKKKSFADSKKVNKSDKSITSKEFDKAKSKQTSLSDKFKNDKVNTLRALGINAKRR